MNLAVSVDVSSRVPHYEQLRAQLAALIGSGDLTDGHRLPTVRVLANDLGIAAGTVARAYRDLEVAGLVRTRRRHGTQVTSPPATLDRAVVVNASHDFVHLARAHGLDDAMIRDLIAAALTPSVDQHPASALGKVGAAIRE